MLWVTSKRIYCLWQGVDAFLLRWASEWLYQRWRGNFRCIKISNFDWDLRLLLLLSSILLHFFRRQYAGLSLGRVRWLLQLTSKIFRNKFYFYHWMVYGRTWQVPNVARGMISFCLLFIWVIKIFISCKRTRCFSIERCLRSWGFEIYSWKSVGDLLNCRWIIISSLTLPFVLFAIMHIWWIVLYIII